MPERVRHDDDLMPAIDRIVTRAGVAPRDLDAIGISIGPGGFTGLRIAVAAVKMLALALDARVVAVPTALVVAAATREEQVGAGPILVTLAAKRGTVWATTLARADDAWRIVDPAPGLVDAAALPIEGVTAVLGDRHLPASAAARCDAAGVPIVEPRFEARACLAVSLRRLAAGQTIDPMRLLPLYPREPEAVRLWHGA